MPTALNLLLDLIFPILCQNCQEEGTYLCLSCQQNLEGAAEKCFACNQPSFSGKTHPDCQSRKVALDGLLVATSFHQKSIQNLIWHLKYSSVEGVVPILGKIMIDFLVSHDLIDYFVNAPVVPVPLHRRRKRLRGFNQAELIALELTKNLRLEFAPVLQRVKNNKRQVDLPKNQRIKNVQGVFEMTTGYSVAGRKFLLVDDVATTGATLNECAKVLEQHGASEIWGLVVARN